MFLSLSVKVQPITFVADELSDARLYQLPFPSMQVKFTSLITVGYFTGFMVKIAGMFLVEQSHEVGTRPFGTMSLTNPFSSNVKTGRKFQA
jgi:hypothetical protein